MFISSKSKKRIFLHKLLWCPRSAAQAPDKMLTNNTVVSAMPAMPTQCNVLKDKELSYVFLCLICQCHYQNPKTLCWLSQVSKDWKAVADSDETWISVHGITKFRSENILSDLKTKRYALSDQLFIAQKAGNKAREIYWRTDRLNQVAEILAYKDYVTISNIYKNAKLAVDNVDKEIRLFHRMLLDPVSVRKTWLWVEGAQPQWEIY